jgi:superfamily II DNA or RNA helicase
MINEERRKIQEEALNALRENHYNGIVLLPTGCGKSWVLIQALRELIEKFSYKKIWYLCNTTVLRDVDFIEELKKWGAEDLIPYIERMCYQSACKKIDEEIDVLIADEFDFSLTDKYVRVYKNNSFKHKILTTAFIDKEKQVFVKNIADVVYSKSLQEVEDKHILNKSQYHFVNFLMTDEETKTYLKYGESISNLMEIKRKFNIALLQIDETHKEWKNLSKNCSYAAFKLESIVRERKRFLNALNSSVKACRRLMKDIYYEDPECKILVFCELTKQADQISKYSYHGTEHQENLVKFRNNEIQALSVCGKVNRGVNISSIKYVIFESANQSKTQFIQRIGRGKRLKEDEILNVYFLIPCYVINGVIKFTKVKEWVIRASNGIDFSKIVDYKFKR